MKHAEPRRRWRDALGVLAFDLPRTLPRLLTRRGWVGIRNRDDVLERSRQGDAFASADMWSSDLHACLVYPTVGRWIMRRALQQWPISFTNRQDSSAKPDVSFVIPHRGLARMPLLQRVIRSVLAQDDVAVECVVVEQSESLELHGLPEEVRNIHLPHPEDPDTWRKSWALNVGVAAARAEIVVCHDGDILVPSAYASEIVRHLREGPFDVAYLQRFLFYLTQSASNEGNIEATLRTGDCESVHQNWVGGTFAIRRSAFLEIGGMDESFVGWGGEDNEFHDRCSLLRRCTFGYLPFVHLWHPPQPTKVSTARDNAHAQTRAKMAMPARERVRALRQLSISPVKDVAT